MTKSKVWKSHSVSKKKSGRGNHIIKLKKDDHQGYKKPGGLLAKHPFRQ